LVSVKYKLYKYLLQVNINIGKMLIKSLAMAEVDSYAKTNDKIDLRAVSSRFKSILLHNQDIIDKRWSECEKCEFLFKPTGNCKKCGCFMKVKTKVATARCPIGKWEKEFDFMKGKKVATNPA
tara:strand:+ start:481 stop:849 length:369 start_codon:yes stop_codon:yes gene_type:complete